TPNSICSDWVRAEAGTAKKEGKLIPIKTADVAYADIPLPFGEMHTENLEASQLIRAAVVAQLAKPAVEPSAVALLTKGFKYELLTWVGIVGGALTLFTNLSAVLKLADWARVLVQHWREWTHGFWVWTFDWLGIHLPPEWTAVLSFLLFGSFLTIGQAVKFKSTIKTQQIADKYHGMSFQLFSWRTFLCFGLIVACLWQPSIIIHLIWNGILSLLPPNLPFGLVILIVESQVFIIPQVILVLFARYRLHAAVTSFILLIFWIIITVSQMYGLRIASANVTALAIISVLPLIVLSVAPAKAVSRRLIFLALGLLLLIALNELSKLGLDVTAPKHG